MGDAFAEQRAKQAEQARERRAKAAELMTEAKECGRAPDSAVVAQALGVRRSVAQRIMREVRQTEALEQRKEQTRRFTVLDLDKFIAELVTLEEQVGPDDYPDNLPTAVQMKKMLTLAKGASEPGALDGAVPEPDLIADRMGIEREQMELWLEDNRVRRAMRMVLADVIIVYRRMIANSKGKAWMHLSWVLDRVFPELHSQNVTLRSGAPLNKKDLTQYNARVQPWTEMRRRLADYYESRDPQKAYEYRESVKRIAGKVIDVEPIDEPT